MMIEEYLKQKKELDDRFSREKPEILPDGTEQYKVEKWSPELFTPKDSPSQMIRLSTIDLLEREMEQEYLRIIQKDKADGKDFNKAAYEHMKLSKYHF
jgi:hypothetical protein